MSSCHHWCFGWDIVNVIMIKGSTLVATEGRGYSRAATVCGNVPFQCFGCTHPPTHRLLPLHFACTFSSTTAVYLLTKFSTLNKTIERYLTVCAMRGCLQLRGYCGTFMYSRISLVHFCFATPRICKLCLKCRGPIRLQFDRKSFLSHAVERYQGELNSYIQTDCNR